MEENRPPGCEGCKKPSCTHLTQIVGGESKQVSFCSSCPHADLLTEKGAHHLVDTVLGLEEPATVEESPTATVTCPQCGLTDEEFRKRGRMGCSKCYEAFDETLHELLKSMHRGLIHKGKVPKALKRRLNLRHKIDTLREYLRQAVSREKYEEAANLRDQIHKIEEQLPD